MVIKHLDKKIIDVLHDCKLIALPYVFLYRINYRANVVGGILMGSFLEKQNISFYKTTRVTLFLNKHS